MQKARRLADDARAFLAEGRYDSATNRAYFAMFNAARALLIDRGHSRETAKTHATVLRLFSQEFVLPGPFEPDDGRALSRAGKARHVADYDDEGVREDEAESVVAAMGKFMRTVERLVDGEQDIGGRTQ